MARQIIQSFPTIPEELNIDSECKNIARLREDMAEEILLAAGNVKKLLLYNVQLMIHLKCINV